MSYEMYIIINKLEQLYVKKKRILSKITGTFVGRGRGWRVIVLAALWSLLGKTLASAVSGD